MSSCSELISFEHVKILVVSPDTGIVEHIDNEDRTVSDFLSLLPMSVGVLLRLTAAWLHSAEAILRSLCNGPRR